MVVYLLSLSERYRVQVTLSTSLTQRFLCVHPDSEALNQAIFQFLSDIF